MKVAGETWQRSRRSSYIQPWALKTLNQFKDNYAALTTLLGLNIMVHTITCSLYQANVPLNDRDQLSFQSNKLAQLILLLLE